MQGGVRQQLHIQEKHIIVQQVIIVVHHQQLVYKVVQVGVDHKRIQQILVIIGHVRK